MSKINVNKPKAILLDMFGIAVRSDFVDKTLFHYIKVNVQKYLDENWNDKEVVRDVERLRVQSAKDESLPKIVGISEDIGKQKKSIADYVIASLGRKDSNRAKSMFCHRMWFKAYDKQQIFTKIILEPIVEIRKWKTNLSLRVFVISYCSTEFSKKMFSHSIYGDLNKYIDGFHNASEHSLEQKQNFEMFLQLNGLQVKDVLFVTKSGKEARVAKELGINSIVCDPSKQNDEVLKKEMIEHDIPIINSLIDISFKN